jgi:hypothetical protein
MTIFGINDFDDGWFSYPSKDLRRLFARGRERGPWSRIYCGNRPQGHLKISRLRARCRAALRHSLAQALKVSARELYGSVCPKDPEPACADQNMFTYASAIQLPPFPYQNRPTFQQVVTLTHSAPR